MARGIPVSGFLDVRCPKWKMRDADEFCHGCMVKQDGKSHRLRVCVVTGTRAEFGIWRPVLRAIKASKRLELKLIVTGMHWLKGFGDTVREIEEAGWKIDAPAAMYRAGEAPAKSLARGTEQLAAAYEKTGAELVMVLGDRLEMLAAASAALACRLPIGHVHGGETAPGIWDEQIRHAITKMAHVHFCSTKTAARRIVQMGEDPRRVHAVGAPALDSLHAWRQQMARTIDPVRASGHKTAATVLLHPSGGTAAEECRRALDMRRAMAAAHIPLSFDIGPNNDPGHEGILQAYREGGIPFEMNLSQDQFWNRLAISAVLIGNSSAGIIEAASFGIPVINIGGRQKGRERNANVIDVSWSPAAIKKAIDKATTDRAFLKLVGRRKNLYGDGHASERMVAELEQIAAAGISLTKQFRDK